MQFVLLMRLEALLAVEKWEQQPLSVAQMAPWLLCEGCQRGEEPVQCFGQRP